MGRMVEDGPRATALTADLRLPPRPLSALPPWRKKKIEDKAKAEAKVLHDKIKTLEADVAKQTGAKPSTAARAAGADDGGKKDWEKLLAKQKRYKPIVTD